MDVLNLDVPREEMEDFLNNDLEENLAVSTDQASTSTATISSAQQPLWPEQPTKCPADTCVAVYDKFQYFQRHWNSVHVPEKVSFQCPCCKAKYWRRDLAKKHLRNKHKLSEAPFQETMESNELYVNPGTGVPYRPNHRLRLANKRHSQQANDTLVTTGTDCRDEVVLFDKEGNTIGKSFRSKRRRQTVSVTVNINDSE